MTTGIEHSYPHSYRLCFSVPNSNSYYWKRCLRRKCNDGSGISIEGFNMPKSEGCILNVNCESSGGSMPQSVHSFKESSDVRNNRSNHLRGSEKFDKRSKSFSQASNSRGLLKEECSEAMPGSLRLDTAPSSSSTDQCLQPQCLQEASLNLSSKKRIHLAMSEENVCSHVRTSENEGLRLREALKVERQNLRELQKDLEEERCASAAAATEAMTMIRRLQEEKSAALVESRHCRLASEEREAYNQEAILLLKEALSVMENEILLLRGRVEAYRCMLWEVNSKRSNQLIRLKEDEKLLLLERSWSDPYSSRNLNERIHSRIEITDVTDEQALSIPTQWYHQPSEIISEPQHDFKDSGWKEDTLEVGTCDIHGTQTLEDESLSILDRVARLEERFARLGRNLVFGSDCYDWASDGKARSLSEQACISENLRNDPIAEDSQDQKDLRNEYLGKIASNSVEIEHDCGYSMPEKCDAPEDLKVTSWDPGHEPKLKDVRETEIESVHDIYEVQCDPNSCGIPSSMDNRISLVNCLDNVNNSLEGSEDKPAEQMLSASFKDDTSLHFSQGCSDPSAQVDAWLMKGERLVRAETMKSIAASEDVQNLKLRLQALEGERAFMKVALESLRKENMELKLLQDIAQQLRELKGDVYKTDWKRSGQDKLLAVLSFLKGILSFPGMQSSATWETRRFLCPYQESSSNSSSCEEHEQAGLFSLLKNHQEEERPIRVMRECKVKLSSMISVAHDCRS